MLSRVTAEEIFAMVLKTPNQKVLPSQKSLTAEAGLTIIEVFIVSFVVLLLGVIAVVNFDPVGKRKKATDEKRLSDIATIDRAISEFVMDHKYYPDQENILRKSTVLPVGAIQLNAANKGWIFDNLSSYISMLPTDPVNDANRYYSYIHDATSYELNAKLEILTDEMLDDGGNDPNAYEVGNNLLLITP